MSKLSIILQVYNDNLVYQMFLWYFWAVSSGGSRISGGGGGGGGGSDLLLRAKRARILEAMPIFGINHAHFDRF